MIADFKFNFGDIVWLVTAVGDDKLSVKGQIVTIYLYPKEVKYQVDWASGEVGTYYDFQLTNSPYPKEEEEEDA